MSLAAAANGSESAEAARSAYASFMAESEGSGYEIGLRNRGGRDLLGKHIPAARAPQLVLLQRLARDGAGLGLARAPGAFDRDGLAVAEARGHHRVLVVGAHED